MNYNINFNLGRPSEDVKIGIDIFRTRYHGANYDIEKRDGQIKGFQFDNDLNNWIIEIFHIEPKFIQGFIKIKSKKRKTFIKEDTILIEFIYANYKAADTKSFRWVALPSQYNMMNPSNKRRIDKCLPLIYEEVRKWERIQSKLKNNG